MKCMQKSKYLIKKKQKQNKERKKEKRNGKKKRKRTTTITTLLSIQIIEKDLCILTHGLMDISEVQRSHKSNMSLDEHVT